MNETNTNQPAKCLNCGTLLQSNFCPQCGQKSSVGRITFKETLKSFLSSAFSIEGPFFRTTRSLIINPGKVFRNFFAGKRKSYYTPVSYFILNTAIYIILRTLIDFDPLEGQMVRMNSDEAPEIAQRSREASRFMVNNINNIMFFLVLSIGLSLKLFFRKQYNLAEYTTAGFFVSGVYILFGILMMLINNYTSLHLQSIQLAFLFSFILYASYSLIQRKSIGAFLKYILVGFLSIILYIVFGFGFSYLLVSFQ
jgi:hypothetical protein